MAMIKNIDKYFKLKPDFIGDPDMYLGAKISYHWTNNGMYAWWLIPLEYITEAVNNGVKYLRDNFEGKYS